MLVSCSNCGKRFKLRDDKLPKAEVFRIPCPNCSSEIVVRKEEPDSGDERPQQAAQSPSFEPEVFPAGARVAFVFLGHELCMDAAKQAVQELGYTPSIAGSMDEAVAKVGMNRYDLVCIDDSESGRAVMEVVNGWPGIRRREVNVVMVGSDAQSLDPGTSFFRGVNGWLNRGDTDRFKQLLGQLEDDFALYRAPWDAVTES